jgi:hypothetical protein
MNGHPFLSAPGLKPDDVLYIFAYGHGVMRPDGEHITLSEADVPLADRHSRHLRRLIGTVLVLSPAGHICKVYKARTKSPSPRPPLRRRALHPMPIV